MCDLCGISHCPPGCPGYHGEVGQGSPLGRCVLCEEMLYAGERVFEKNGDLLCEGCVAVAALNDILAAEGVQDTAELLCDCLGWRWRSR